MIYQSKTVLAYVNNVHTNLTNKQVITIISTYLEKIIYVNLKLIKIKFFRMEHIIFYLVFE